jgi:hypothetical protein
MGPKKQGRRQGHSLLLTGHNTASATSQALREMRRGTPYTPCLNDKSSSQGQDPHSQKQTRKAVQTIVCAGLLTPAS